jgi:ATP/ADP translocase
VARLPERAVFYAAVLPLLAFYALFAAVLYPLSGSLHPLELMHSLLPSVPIGERGWVGGEGGGARVRARVGELCEHTHAR